MSNHTPGPWIITKGDEWTDCIHTETESQGIWTVASVNKRRDEFEANRCLIAAAPDLLTALKDLDECYCESGNDLSREDRNRHRIVLIAVRAAIAKATGAA